MEQRPRTREEIWQRILSTSREDIILEEMIRLGFWSSPDRDVGTPPEEARRLRELQQQLATLQSESHRLQNADAVLKDLRRRRMQESKRKQQETKARREQERLERAARWKQRKAAEIGYLGVGVSGGLNAGEGTPGRLDAQDLPLLTSPEQLASAMGLQVGALRFLAFDRKVSNVTHYVRFLIPKKPTGQRLISAPMPRLKTAQRWIQREILDRVPLHEAAHGFRQDRSIVTNAQPHIGARILVNVDLKDFFPTISYRRVKGLFRGLGYPQSVATVLALLCTEPPIEQIEMDGKNWFVALGQRHLPQGAPSSPAISNLICRRLDRRLSTAATRLGFVYTRYADDLSFSSTTASPEVAARLLRRIAYAVGQEGFLVHPDKSRIARASRRQEVTGLIVNRKLAVPKDVLKRFRATLYQIEKDGPAGKRWGNTADVLSSIRGFANYVAMVDPQAGARLQEKVRQLLTRFQGLPPANIPQPEVPPPVQDEPLQPQLPALLEPTPPEPLPPPPDLAPPSQPKDWWKMW